MKTGVNPDLYQIMGVAENATEDAIRKAYRELARKYHPDKTGGDKAAETRLKEINAAYNILKNKEKRAEYDKRRTTGSFEGFDFGEGIDISDLFGSMFGGGFSGGFGGPGSRTRARSAARPGNDLEARVRISLGDVVSGTKKTLRINRPETCSDCTGSGAAAGSAPGACPDCGGSGMVSRGSHAFQINQTCRRCQGTGQTIANPCARCGGSGRVSAQREISVAIPAGIDAGSRLRVAGEGEAGYQGGARGDLFVRVEIDDDPFFKRDGRNLICEVPITFAEAALGAKVTVPTLDGIAKLTIEPGTQHGQQLRMRGLGLPGVGGGGRGDEIVKVVVEVPRKLTPEQKRLLREFDGNYEPESHPVRDAFLAILRKFREWVGD